MGEKSRKLGEVVANEVRKLDGEDSMYAKECLGYCRTTSTLSRLTVPHHTPQHLEAHAYSRITATLSPQVPTKLTVRLFPPISTPASRMASHDRGDLV